MKKEKTFKLNAVLAGQTRNIMLAFLATLSTTIAATSGYRAVDNINTTKRTYRDATGNQELPKNAKKELARETTRYAVFAVVALALLVASCGAMRGTKRENDEAAVRIARRYVLQMRAKNPALKKYDYILNNEMAMHNIAAGLANKLSGNQLFEISDEWDWLRDISVRSNLGATGELRLKNRSIERVISKLDAIAKKDETFVSYLEKLMEDSAKTFALTKYMMKQMGR